MNKLAVPNDNYIIAICATCGKEFIKRKGTSTKQLGPGIRPARAQNCSKLCTRRYKKVKTPAINKASLEEQDDR